MPPQDQQEAVKNETEKGCVSQDPYAIGYQTILTAAHATAVDEEAGEQVPLDKRNSYGATVDRHNKH